jgi:hypothetical protein
MSKKGSKIQNYFAWGTPKERSPLSASWALDEANKLPRRCIGGLLRIPLPRAPVGLVQASGQIIQCRDVPLLLLDTTATRPSQVVRGTQTNVKVAKM